MQIRIKALLALRCMHIKTIDAGILHMQSFVQNWPTCTELSLDDQVAQKWKNFADFSAILFLSSTLTTAT